MFGNNNVTSSWANPQQNQPNQQQQQGTNAFGQPQATPAFGSGGAFGTGAFGTQQQPQQPVNPMFGGTAAATTTTTPGTTGFGGFGAGGAGGANTSAFGAKPTTGFGGFGGGTSTFGTGGNAFGANANTGTSTAAFGQPSTTTNAFGGGTGLFGAPKPAAPTGAFGSVSNTATAPNTDNGTGGVAPVTTGSANPPYSVFQEKDSTNANVTLHYQSISTMPAYRGTSFEEIRMQDYSQGRKTAGSSTGAFGQTSVFGAQPAQPQTGAFGQPAASTSGFGGFGQNNQPAQPAPNAFGAFGQPAAPASQPSVFGGTNTFGTLGQNQTQPAQPTTNLFGGFGQNNAANNNPQQQQQGTTSTFGGFGTNNQPKPFGTFGGGSTFGQNTQQQNPQPASTGLFGQPQNQQQGQTSAFGAFGTNNNQPKPSLFGGTTTTQPATGGFGLFGQNQNQQNQQNQTQPAAGLFGNTNTGTSLFGGQNQNQQQAGQTQPTQQQGGLFGNTQPAQQSTTGSLFGGGGLFGNNNQQKPAFGGGLFGSTNTTNSATAQPQGNMFGQPANQAPQPAGTSTFGSSLFGNKSTTAAPAFGQSFAQPATNTGSSLFGSTVGGNNGGLFGSSANQAQGSQPTLTASIAQPVSTNLPIFSLLQSGAQSAPVNPPPKKQSSYFIDVPTRSPLALSTSRNMGGTKLRGFGFSQSTGRNAVNGLSSPTGLSASLSNSLLLSRVGDNKSLLGPESFIGSSTLGSDGRPSPKKLVLDKKMDPNEVFGRSSGQQKNAATNSKVAFNPAMSAALREKESLGKTPASNVSAVSPSSPAAKTAVPLSASNSPARDKGLGGQDDLQEGDYWVKPSLDVLRNTSNVELSSFKGLSVGRKGYGEVSFLEPVDLTALPRLSALLGKIVQIENKECCVYPDTVDGSTDDLKPPPGEGVNVRARIVLLGCWPVDKATREPIKDESHPAFMKHLKRLKGMKHTKFESYSIDDGKWIFTVEHF